MYNQKSINGPTYRAKFIDAMLKNLSDNYEEHDAHSERLQKLIVNYANTFDLSISYKNDLILLARYHDIGRVQREMNDTMETAYSSNNTNYSFKINIRIYILRKKVFKFKFHLI